MGLGAPPALQVKLFVARNSSRIDKLVQRVLSDFWPSKEQPTNEADSKRQADEPTAEKPEETCDLKSTQIASVLKGNTIRKGDFAKQSDYYNLLNAAKHFKWESGDLWKVRGGRQVRVLLTKGAIEEAIWRAHNSGHFGRDATLDMLTKSVWWRGNMKDDVAETIRKCETCQQHNPATIKVVPELIHVGYRAEIFSLLAVDLKTLPTSTSGHRYLLTVVDYFSKFVILGCIKDKTATAVLNFLVPSVFYTHGCPDMMLSDNGGEFRSDISARVLSVFGVSQRFITPNNPQPNGLCERMNGVMSSVTAKLCDGNIDSWHERIAESAFYYNGKKSTSTGKSPYEIVYGRDCVTKVVAKYRDQPTVDSIEAWVAEFEDANYDDAFVAMSHARYLLAEEVMAQQRKKDKANKEYYDANRKKRGQSYEKGDLVMKTDRQIGKKMHGRLAPKWDGPYVVTKVHKTCLQLKRVGESGKTANAPISLVKRYYVAENR